MSAFRRVLQSIAAVFAGFVAVVALSLTTDQILHGLEVFPPWTEPMNDVGDNLLALGYRSVYAIFGCYLTARLAQRNPMFHAMIGGTIGFVLSAGGAIAAINMNLGPVWYPVALVLSALPCAWLGGVLHRQLHA